MTGAFEVLTTDPLDLVPAVGLVDDVVGVEGVGVLVVIGD